MHHEERAKTALEDASVSCDWSAEATPGQMTNDKT